MIWWTGTLLFFGSSPAGSAQPPTANVEVAASDRHTEAWHWIHQALDEARRLVEANHFDEAEAVLQPMLEHAAELEGQDLQLAGEVVEILAKALHRSGRDVELADRRQLFDIMRRQEEALGPHHPAITQVLLELACLSYTWGTVKETEKLYRRVALLQTRSPPNDPLAIARTYVYLGSLLVEGGYPGKARLAFTKALQFAEGTLGTVDEVLELPELETHHGVMAEALGDLGASAGRMGDLPTARRFLGKAALLFERSIGEDHPAAALVHFHLGWVERRSGHMERALAELRHVLKVWRASLGDDHFYLGIVRLELGALLTSMGRLDEARRHVQAAVINLKASLGTDSYRTAAALSRLAGLLWRDGDFEGAKLSYEEAQQMHASAPFFEHPHAALTLDQLGRLLWRTGEPTAAFDVALRAEATGRETFHTYLHSTAEREALYLDGLRPGGLDLLATILAEGGGDVALGWSEVIRSRTLVFDDVIARYQAAREGDQPDKQQRWLTLAQARQRLANLHVRHRGEHNAGPRLREALAAREEAERNLEDVSETYRQENQRRRAGFAEIRARLPSTGALLAYLRYQHADPTASGPKAPGTASYLALAWAPGMTEPVAVPLGTAAAIDQQVERARSQIGRHSEARYRRAAVQLRRLIWDPVAPHVAEAERLLVVADGSLHQIPLTALPLDKGGYWIERGQELQYLPAERDLLAAPNGGAGSGGQLALLSLGGANFDSRAALLGRTESLHSQHQLQLSQELVAEGSRSVLLPSCAAWQGVRYPSLRGSGLEARQVSALYQEWTADHRVLELVGAAATEAAFKTWAPRSRNLHLATHGFSWQGKCESPGEVMSPFLWSGLALAGANHRADAAANGEDGILTAEEIAGLDLSAVDWAVLSACDTGVGEAVPGEGVLGLQRAFRIAGVQTLVVSLWPVDDEVTGELMTSLYRNRWQHGRDAASAVATASLEILNQRRLAGLDTHPYFWAPFIAVGG